MSDALEFAFWRESERRDEAGESERRNDVSVRKERRERSKGLENAF